MGLGVTEVRLSAPKFPKGLQTFPDATEEAPAINLRAGTNEGLEEVGGMDFGMVVAVTDAVELIDPASLEEARRRLDWGKWDEAIQKELGALKDAGTWGLVERLKGRNVVASKWVLHIKKDTSSMIKHYKARL